MTHPITAIARNAAEFLIDLGHMTRRVMRHGATLPQAVSVLCLQPSVCELAILFLAANEGLKFRALVEDWSLPRIIEELMSWDPRKQSGAPNGDTVSATVSLEQGQV